MHEQFVEPSKKNADLVVLEGGKNLVALEMIMSQIRHHIDHNDQTPTLIDDADIT
jgi:uridine kinase